MGQGLSLAISIGVPLVYAYGLNFLTRENVKGWYKLLKKPKWTPPNWVFGPAWTVLYCCMGTASWLIWLDGGFKEQKGPLTWYGIQLVFNLLWTPLFFGAKKPKYALLDIAALDVTAVKTTMAFFHVNKTAGYLMMPYLGWLLYATALNATIVKDNQTRPPLKGPQSAPPPIAPSRLPTRVTERD